MRLLSKPEVDGSISGHTRSVGAGPSMSVPSQPTGVALAVSRRKIATTFVNLRHVLSCIPIIKVMGKRTAYGHGPGNTSLVTAGGEMFRPVFSSSVKFVHAEIVH